MTATASCKACATSSRTGAPMPDRSCCSAPADPRGPWWWRCWRTARQQIKIANRTAEKAQAIAKEFGSSVTAIAWADRNAAMAERRAADQLHRPRHGRQARARCRPVAAGAGHDGRRPHLHAAGNAVPGTSARARLRDGERARPAAQSGEAGIQGLVRRPCPTSRPSLSRPFRPRSKGVVEGVLRR